MLIIISISFQNNQSPPEVISDTNSILKAPVINGSTNYTLGSISHSFA
jgi:hypothetical protein